MKKIKSIDDVHQNEIANNEFRLLDIGFSMENFQSQRMNCMKDKNLVHRKVRKDRKDVVALTLRPLRALR